MCRLLKFSNLVLFTAILISFSSCKIIKTSSYFKDLKRDTVLTINNDAAEELKIKKGDVLSINISSLSKIEDELYNSKSATLASPAGSGYQVGNAGEIYVHKIGKLIVEGLTRKQLKATLEEQLIPYLKDPIATVNFENHHVTVIGEIGRPQLLPMPEEKISIIDVLAQSGTITQVAELSNILVIRDKDNKKELKHVNLEDHSIFNSPYYYLQPNDIVVLNPNDKRLQRDLKRQNYQQVSSIFLQVLTIGLIIYQTFFRK